MIATSMEQSDLANLWDTTKRMLKDLHWQQMPLLEEFARAESLNGRTILEACWGKIGVASTESECRMVRIQGVNSLILNTMIFPSHPDKIPTFVAEIICIGGIPRVVFIDVQTPGMPAGISQELSECIRRTSTQLQQADPGEKPPDWATEYSTGNYFYFRWNGTAILSAIEEIYQDYLEHWIHWVKRSEVASNQCTNFENQSFSQQELRSFQKHHRELSPAKTWLEKMFSVNWADRFLGEFLYRMR